MSPTTMSPGFTTMPPTETGTLISPGPSLYGPRWLTPRAYTGKVALADLRHVADARRRAPRRTADLRGIERQDAADHRVVDMSPPASITSTSPGRQNSKARRIGQVVAAARARGDGRARHGLLAGAVIGLQAHGADVAVHVVAERGDGNVAQRFEDLRVGLRRGGILADGFEVLMRVLGVACWTGVQCSSATAPRDARAAFVEVVDRGRDRQPEVGRQAIGRARRPTATPALSSRYITRRRPRAAACRRASSCRSGRRS